MHPIVPVPAAFAMSMLSPNDGPLLRFPTLRLPCLGLTIRSL